MKRRRQPAQNATALPLRADIAWRRAHVSVGPIAAIASRAHLMQTDSYRYFAASS